MTKVTADRRLLSAVERKEECLEVFKLTGIPSYTFFLTTLLLCSFLCCREAAAEDATPVSGGSLKILRVTPEGEDVPAGKQIVLEFNRPVVPLGRMERRNDEIPITIVPPVSCSWRWLTTSTLACQMGEEHALREATRYTIDVLPGITAEDGAGLEAPAQFAFVTTRPTVRTAYFSKWLSPALPELTLVFDLAVERDSVTQHAFFRTGGTTRHALSVEAAPYYEDRAFLVKPVAELPENTEVELVVEPGIKAKAGPEPGIEDKAATTFKTFPEFRLLGVRCYSIGGEEVVIAAGNEQEAKAKECDPLQTVSLSFSSPVIKEAVKDVLTVTPAFAGAPGFDPWEEVYSYSRLGSANQADSQYELQLPGVLKAKTRYELKAGEIKDEFGRALATPLQTVFFTSHRQPQFTLLHPYSVLETGVGTDAPVAVTNLRKLTMHFEAQTASGIVKDKEAALELYPVEDIAYLLPLQISKQLGAASGAIKGVLESDPPNEEEGSGELFSTLTPFHVHLKMGHYSSLAWVTRFSDGEPVPRAKVSLYMDHRSTFAENPSVLASGVTGENGVAILPGLQEISPDQAVLGEESIWSRAEGDYPMLKVELGNEVGFLPVIYDFFQSPQGPNGSYIPFSLRKRHGHMKSWGTTPQGVYRAGDRIQYKIYVRDQDNRHFIPPQAEKYTLEVHDPMDNVVYKTAGIHLSDFGAFSGELTVPKSAPVGWYRFDVSASFTTETFSPMQVLVSDFTPSPFKVTTDIQGKLFHEGDTLNVATGATLHSGGPYGSAKAVITARSAPSLLTAAEPRFEHFTFDVQDDSNQAAFHEAREQLDAQGKLSSAIAVPDLKISYGTISVESAVEDDRGKSVANRASANYVGRDRYVGIFYDGWVLDSLMPATVQALVVDEQGRTAPGTPATLRVEYSEITAARVKGAGNAYITEYQERWVPVAECRQISGTEPMTCSFVPGKPGSYRVFAEISDTKNRQHQSKLQLWATGPGEVVWETEEGNRLDMSADKKSYKVGEKVKVLVQNPYPGAQALISVERFGVLKTWVQTLEGNTPVIELEVEPDFLPGVFLSVLVMSPRVEKPMGENQVDLGKPAFKMGYLPLSLKDDDKKLQIAAASDKESYKPGDTVKVELSAQAKDGRQRPIEYAVAVLDEAVLDLIQSGEGYFDPYEGFYASDSLDLVNYNLIRQLVGRIKFEKKGANPGGGGDSAKLKMRSNFKFVSYWNPALPADASGKASISFTVPDNLTGWRVLAIAMTKDDYMGLGTGRFVVNQSTEIRPALPNQVVAGDRFSAGFTVMNRTEKARSLSVAIDAEGPLDGAKEVKERVSAEPFARQTVRLPLTTTSPGNIEFEVTAGDEADRDGLKASVPVLPRAAKETAAVYGISVEPKVSTNLEVPADIGAAGGDFTMSVSPTVLSDLEGSFVYMREYPYACWEQRLTKGVMAAQYQDLKKYLPASFQWADSNTLPNAMLSQAADFQAMNGGMAYYIGKDEYADPYLSAYTALAFNWLADGGFAVPENVQSKLHEYLLKVLREDKEPEYGSREMQLTVRTVILAALAPHGKVTRNDALRFLPELKRLSVFGKAQLLSALAKLPNTDEAAKRVFSDIRAHINESGGKLVVNEVDDDGFKRILSSPLRSACAVLSAVAKGAASSPGSKNTDADMAFKLIRAVTQSRGAKSHWQNTQENMFCANALREYSKSFEADTPNVHVTAKLGGQELGSAIIDSFSTPPAVFTRALTPADAGQKMTADLERSGNGRVYLTAALTYTPKDLPAAPANNGIEVRREYSVYREGSWRLLKHPMQLKTGELVKINLFVVIPAARNFVVVDDPLPGGLEPVNKDFANTAQVPMEKSQSYALDSYIHEAEGWKDYGESRWSFYFTELRHDRGRFYSEYLAPGRYALSYTAQAIAPGTFTALPVRAEEMYDTEIFGRGVAETLEVTLAQ